MWLRPTRLPTWSSPGRWPAPFIARRCWRVPAFALRLAFGEMVDSTILQSERVVPARLSAAGFDFEYPELDGALRALLPPSKRMIYVWRA